MIESNKEMYQLVLQFPTGNKYGLEDLIFIEDKLREIFDHRIEIDGHDIGLEEMNIFIITAKPNMISGHCIDIINNINIIPLLGVGYRNVNCDEYKRIWPKDNKDKFIVA